MQKSSLLLNKTLQRLAVFCFLSICLSLTGCSGGPDDKATIQSLKDLGLIVVVNNEQVNGLNNLPTDPAKLTEAIEAASTLNALKTVTAMAGVPITDEHLATIGKNGSLVELTLDGAPISDTGIASLTGCKKLESLKLANTPVTSDCLASLGKLSKLNVLNLNNTKVSGGFEALQSCGELQWILVGGLTISDADAEAISKIPAISHVTLSNTTEISDGARKIMKSQNKDCNVDLVVMDAPAPAGAN